MPAAIPPLPAPLREVCRLLAGEEAGPVPAEVAAAARAAGVLDVLASRPGLRARLPGADGAEAFLQAAALGALRLRALQRLTETLEAAGIPVIALKGMAYALMFESGGPTRAMADTDLLVPEAQYEQACRLVAGLGYQEHVPKPLAQAPGYHERAFRGPAREGGLLLEVHRRFLPGRRVAVDYHGLWARSAPAGAECPACRLLGDEDAFLYHALHMGAHEFTHGLRPVWELRRLLVLRRPDLAAAARGARAWGTLRMSWCALRLLDLCFPGALCPADLARFAPRAPVRALLERLVVGPSIALLAQPGPLPRAEQLLRKSLLVERPIGALSYLGWYLQNR
jgi:hypothetical protein